MRKTLREIYNRAWNHALENGTYIIACQKHGLTAVAEAVRKRVRRQIAAENRRKEMAESKWVLR